MKLYIAIFEEYCLIASWLGSKQMGKLKYMESTKIEYQQVRNYPLSSDFDNVMCNYSRLKEKRKGGGGK